MEKENINIVYQSSIDKIVEVNSSFDRGILKVAYTGKNRNKSFISKEAFERSIDTIYNCPVVCNYNRETDSIGSHDVDIVKTSKGMKIVNITQPVGLVPESANYWWEYIEEDNGDVHEYLCVDVILWKRQEAYFKIKENGITDESMEITVKSGKTVDGCYHIDSFEFTAFCLLESAEPCFESACVQVFSLDEFKNEYSKMMDDFKNHFLTVNTSIEDDIQDVTQNLSKGGNISLDKLELLKEYGLTPENLEFNIDEITVDELRSKLEEMSLGQSGNEDPSVEPEPTAGSYALSGEQFRTQLIESLEVVIYTDPYWGEMCRYCYVDYDYEESEVYCYDFEDWNLYGFKYSMNGDNIVIDFDSKKRKKFSIVDFDEGSTEFNYKHAFEMFSNAIVASKDAEISQVKSDYEEKYSVASTTIDDLQKEVNDLRAYQKSKIDEERHEAEEEIFSRFVELSGIEAFDELRNSCSDMTIEDIENKCFEIKGRHSTANFSVNKPAKPTRIVVEKNAFDDEPYGGIFLKYPPKNN